MSCKWIDPEAVAQRCSIEKGALINFGKLTGKHLCQSLFFNKVAASNFIKKETLAQVFSCEFAKFLRTPFSQNRSGRLLLNHPHAYKETLEQPIILNPHTKLNFSSNNPYFYSTPIKIITDKFSKLETSVNLSNQVSFPTRDLKKNWVIVPNNWKHKNWKQYSQKSLFKILFFNFQGK